MRAKKKDPTRVTLRFTNPALRKQYDELAKPSPFSFTGLVELAMEIALPVLRERLTQLKEPPESRPKTPGNPKA